MAPPRKRKLEDLTVDEFLAGGFALAGSEGAMPAPEPGPAPPAGRARSEAAQHKAQLAALQQQDPEFYAYLQQTDQELLQFGEGSEDEGSADSAGRDAPAEVAAEASEGSDGEEEVHAGSRRGKPEKDEGRASAGGAPPAAPLCATALLEGNWQLQQEAVCAGKSGLRVTAELIDRWCRDARATCSYRAMRSLLRVRRACLHSAACFCPLAEALRAAAGIPLCVPLWGHGGGPGVHAAHYKRGRHGPPGHVHAGRGERLLRLCADAFCLPL